MWGIKAKEVLFTINYIYTFGRWNKSGERGSLRNV